MTKSNSQPLRITHALAEVNFGRRDYQNAAKWCLQTRQGVQATFGMNDPLFTKSIDLIARIHEARGDFIQAETYRSIFSSEFLSIFPL